MESTAETIETVTDSTKSSGAPENTPSTKTEASGAPENTPKTEASGAPENTPSPQTEASGAPENTPKTEASGAPENTPKTEASGAPENTPSPQTEASGAPVNTPSPTEASGLDEASGAGATGEMSAFVVGYTGEVGKEVVKELARRNVFKKVLLLGRRTVEYKDESIANNSKIEQVKVDFEDLDKSKDVFEGVDVGFCCLGSTLNKAGKKGVIKVDHDYVVKTAELAKLGGCKQFHLITGQGTNINSRFFYPRIKGQAEEDVKAVGIPRTSIYRPAMLMCDRAEEARLAEWVFCKLLTPIHYVTPGTISHSTHIVAKAMINNINVDLDKPVEMFQGKALHRLGTQKN